MKDVTTALFDKSMKIMSKIVEYARRTEGSNDVDMARGKSV